VRERIIRRSPIEHCSYSDRARSAGDLRRIQRAWPYRAGVAGAISVLLGLSALSVLPINWAGAALLILAFALFALEAKFTSHGILDWAEPFAMVLGAVLLVDSPLPELRIRWSVAIALAVPFAAITDLAGDAGDPGALQ